MQEIQAERRIGRLVLLEQIGSRAFGNVFKARDTELDRVVAIKIPRQGALDAVECERFLCEARSAAQLKHPNIDSVHEFGREDGSLYIVTDFVEGMTLADWLTGQLPDARGRPLSWRRLRGRCSMHMNRG